MTLHAAAAAAVFLVAAGRHDAHPGEPFGQVLCPGSVLLLLLLLLPEGLPGGPAGGLYLLQVGLPDHHLAILAAGAEVVTLDVIRKKHGWAFAVLFGSKVVQ